MLCVNPSQYLLLSQVVLANKEIIAAKSNYHIGISVQAQQGKGLPNWGYQEIDVFASMNDFLKSPVVAAAPEGDLEKKEREQPWAVSRF